MNEYNIASIYQMAKDIIDITEKKWPEEKNLF